MFRIITILLICNVSLMAQSDQDSVTFSVSLEDFVITAQHEPTHYKEVIHQIDIIKKETITQIGAVTLDQVLITSPSIRLYEDPILGTSVRMRGVSATNVAILIDGVPVIGRNDGAIDLSQISLQNVEQIEIVEGPLSNIYGSNAAGGVINIITKKSQISTWSVSQSNQLESIGQRNHTVSVGYQKGKFNTVINTRYFDYTQYAIDSLRLIDRDTLDDGTTRTNTRYPFNPKTQKAIGAFLRYNIKEDQHIVAKYQYNDESVVDYGIIKRPQFNPYATDQFYSTKRNDLSINYKGSINKKLFINALSSLNYYDRIRDDKRYYTESMTFDSLLQTSDSISFDQLFMRTDVHYSGIKNWIIGGGFNYTNETGTGDRLIERGSVDSLKTSFHETAVYTDIKYNGIKNLNLAIGNRWIHHNTYGHAFTTSAQLKYDITQQMTLRSSYAQGYRNPSLKELYLEFIDINHNIIGNVDLKPERSFDYQSTLTYGASEKVAFSVNAYYTSIDDRITLTEYESLKFQYDNVDKYSVFGIQPSVDLTISGLSVSSALSVGYWSTNIDREDSPQYGNVLDLNNTLRYTWDRSRVSFFFNHRYTGAQPTYRLQDDEIEIGSIEDYHLVDLSISKTFWKERINIIAGMRNLTNTTFVDVLNSSGGTHSGGGRNSISVGRRWFVTASLAIN